jgi:drug/metabolite transporter (DMT)-like permease
VTRTRTKGLVEITLGSLGFGFLGIFGKWAYQSGLTVGELLTARFIIASVLLWLGLFVFNRRKIVLSRQQILISAGLGVFGYAVFATLYFTAIQGMSVGLAALLLYTYPFWVSLLSHFFLGSRMSLRQWLLLLGASIGVGLLLWGQFQLKHPEFLLAGLGSALTYACYILFSERAQKDVPPLSSSLYVITFGAIALAAFHHPSFTFWTNLTPQQGWILLGIATVSTIFPMTMILAGLQKLKSSDAALISMLEPVTAVIAAVLLLHEVMSLRQVLGAVIVILCLALSVRPGSRTLEIVS